MIKTLITHSGSFHADDLLAYGVLSAIFPQAALLRSRDANLIEAAGAGAIVFDVGNVYDPARNRFDHHQPDRPERPDGIPYSSFGLIWKHFGPRFLEEVMGFDAETSMEVHTRVDARFVRDIDATDNGVLGEDQKGLMHPMALPSLLSLFRPAFDNDDPAADDQMFLEAAEMAGRIFRARLEKTAEKLRSERIVRAAIAERPHSKWLELPRGMDYLGPLVEMDDTEIQYVVFPLRGEWIINAVNIAPGSFEMRKPLPEAWAGLRDEELVRVTGVQDATFCHIGRFVAVAKSRKGAISLLEQALAV